MGHPFLLELIRVRNSFHTLILNQCRHHPTVPLQMANQLPRRPGPRWWSRTSSDSWWTKRVCGQCVRQGWGPYKTRRLQGNKYSKLNDITYNNIYEHKGLTKGNNITYNIYQYHPQNVGQVDAPCDGYRAFFAVSEWWTFKTRFSQWYTKSYNNMCLPLMADMNVSPGHVSWHKASQSIFQELLKIKAPSTNSHFLPNFQHFSGPSTRSLQGKCDNSAACASDWCCKQYGGDLSSGYPIAIGILSWWCSASMQGSIGDFGGTW